MTPLKLSPEERACALWRRIDALTQERIESCRRQNDGDQSIEKTAKLRGRISELKQLRNLLAMDTSPAPVMDGGS